MKLFHWLIASLMALMVSVGVGIIDTTPAYADDPSCSQVVVDEANILGSGKASVEAAALNLGGADVHVVTLKTFGSSPSFTDYMVGRVKQCSGWMNSAKTDFKSNLLLFAVSESERKIYFTYGSSYKRYFDDGANQNMVRSAMGAQFKNQAWPEGFVDGINVAQEVLTTPTSQQVEPVPTTQVTNNIDLSWLKWVLLALLMIGAVVAVVFFGNRWLQANNLRKAARQKALSVADAVTRLLQPLGNQAQQAARIAAVSTYSKVSPEAAQKLSDLKKKLDSAYVAATIGVHSVESSRGNADMQGLSLPEYQELIDRWGDVMTDAKAADEAARDIDVYVDAIKKTVAQVPSLVSALVLKVGNVLEAIEELRAQGYDVSTLDSLVKTANSDLEKVQKPSEAIALLPFIAKANNSADDLVDAHAKLAEEIRSAKEGIARLETDLAHAPGKVESAQQRFEEIRVNYGESSARPVLGNGTEALKRFAAASKLLAEAKANSVQGVEKWSKANKAIEQGDQLVADAVSLLDAIASRLKHLGIAKASAVREIEAAQSDINLASAYVRQYDDDIKDELWNSLKKAGTTLDEARKLLAVDKPDYLKVVEKALEANSFADRIYQEAASEHEAAERLRRLSVETLQQAEAAESKARRFVDNHSSDVGRHAEGLVKNAALLLAKAKEMQGAERILASAKKALEAANDAYRAAKSDFDNAEAARAAERARIERKRREEEAADRREEERRSSYSSTTVVAGGWGSSSSSSYGGGFSSGGDSGFGGGGGGGGFSSGGDSGF